MDDERTIEDVEEILLRADAEGTEVPAGIEDELVAFYRDRYGMKPHVNAALHRLPPERFARFAAMVKDAIAAREEELETSTTIEFAEFVPEMKLEERWIETFVNNAVWALDRNNFWGSYRTLSSCLEEAVAASEHGITIIERAMAQVATHPKFAASETGAELRLLVRRVRFMALRGSHRPIELVFPGDDVRWVNYVTDGIGRGAPLESVAPDEIDQLFAAWSALDWDSTLDVSSMFEREYVPPAIEDRPWDELATLVGKTSLQRLRRGELEGRALSRVFARPEPIEDRIAVAENIAQFAKDHGGTGADAMTHVYTALAPQLVAHDVVMTGALEAYAYKMFSKGELRELFLGLPKRQVSAWIAKLAKSKSAKTKQLAKEYASAIAER